MKHKFLLLTSMGLLMVAGATSASAAGPVAPGFTDGGTLPACDDCFTGVIPTSFSENFFGNTYNGFFVSNNGYITFNTGQGTYTPSGLGSGYSGQPIIAAYFADVDTRGIGSVNYGTGTYSGHNAYGVTWDNVGYYSGQTDKTNTFQIILTDRSDVASGDFDIYFNYNQVQFETGGASGGSDGLGGVSAAVGYNAGQPGNPAGTYFEQPGSLVNGALIDGGPNQLITATNDGVPGQLAFQVRAGMVAPPPPTVPEPATWAMMLVGFGALGFALRARRQQAVRLTYA